MQQSTTQIQVQIQPPRFIRMVLGFEHGIMICLYHQHHRTIAVMVDNFDWRMIVSEDVSLTIVYCVCVSLLLQLNIYQFQFCEIHRTESVFKIVNVGHMHQL